MDIVDANIFRWGQGVGDMLMCHGKGGCQPGDQLTDGTVIETDGEIGKVTGLPNCTIPPAVLSAVDDDCGILGDGGWVVVMISFTFFRLYTDGGQEVDDVGLVELVK